MYQDLVRNKLGEAAEALVNFLKDNANTHAIRCAAVLLASSFEADDKVLSCGNGGSHCNATHFAEELTGCYHENRLGYPAIAISGVSHTSCVSNNFGCDYVFFRYVKAMGRGGDALLGISASGNSDNVIRAVTAARERRMRMIALIGKDNGEMANGAGIEVRMPYFNHIDHIQEIHIKVIHILTQLIEREVIKP